MVLLWHVENLKVPPPQTILFIGDGSLYASFLSEVHNEC